LQQKLEMAEGPVLSEKIAEAIAKEREDADKRWGAVLRAA